MCRNASARTLPRSADDGRATWDHVGTRARARPADGDGGALSRDEHDVRVSWDVRSLQGFADASIPDLAQRYDLLVYDHPHIGEIVPTGSLLAIDELIDADFIADQAANSVGPSHRSYEWDGHLWGARGRRRRPRGRLPARPARAARRRECPRRWDDVLRARRARAHAGHAREPADAARRHARDVAHARRERGRRPVPGRGADPAARCRHGAPRDARAARRALAAGRASAGTRSGCASAWRAPTTSSTARCSSTTRTTAALASARSLLAWSARPLGGPRPRRRRDRRRRHRHLGAHEAREAGRAYARYVASPEIQRTRLRRGGRPAGPSQRLDRRGGERARDGLLPRHAAGPRRRLPAPALRRAAARAERGRRHHLGAPEDRRRPHGAARSARRPVPPLAAGGMHA